MFFKINFKKCREALLVVIIGPISLGVSFGWSSPILPQLQNNNFTLPITLTVSEGSWVGSMFALGVLLGSIPIGYLGDRFGSKKMLALMVIPYVIFMLMVVFARDVYLLCTGRFFAGLGASGFSALSLVYLAEVLNASTRGTLMVMNEFLIYVGLLLVSICGAYINYVTLTIALGLFTLINGILLCFFPESPAHLLRKNQKEKALKALTFFRDKDVNNQEKIESIQSSLVLRETVNIKNTLKSKGFIRGAIAGFGLLAFRQLSGMDSITFYNVQVWQAVDTSADAYVLATIMSALQLLSYLVTVFLVEKFSRRTLLNTSAFVCGVNAFTMGVYFHLKYFNYYFSGIHYIPLVCISLYFIGFAVGLGPLPWIINGELYPPTVKGIACGMGSSLYCLLMFFNTKAFPIVMEEARVHYVFYFYAACMLACIVFVKFCVPETKGKSLEQIQKELNV